MMPPVQIRRVGRISRCSKCRRYCRKVTTFLFSHVGLCALVVGYSIVGAFTFEALEAGYEMKKRQTMIKERQHVVNDLWNITCSSILLSETNWSERASFTLSEFEVTLVKAVRKEGYDGKEESPLQWTFSGALLYSIIVITTIGYGNIAPKTPWGKIVTVFYAIVGIPLLLLCLSNIGDAMAHSFRFIYWKVCCYFCIRPRKKRKKQRQLISYKLPVVRPCIANHVTSICKDSPNESSTSSFYTAQAASEANTSSPPSSPAVLSQHSASSCNQLQVPDYKQDIQQQKSENHCHPWINNEYASNVDIGPIISNRYILQPGQDLTVDMPPHTVATKPSAIFTISPPQTRKECTFKASNPSNGMVWKNVAEELDSDESRLDMTPEPDEEVDVPMWLCIALVVSYICGGAVLFTFWEKWNFLDSSYFCFVTLTTIGFGDLVPGTAVMSDDNQLTLGLCSLYLLFGMALLAMSFNLVQEEVTRTVRFIGQRIGIIANDEDD